MQASDAFEPIEAGKFRETAESNAEMRELVSRVSRLFGVDSRTFATFKLTIKRRVYYSQRTRRDPALRNCLTQLIINY